MSLPRPALHYSPSSGWVNDPLALTFHDGRYHLFFQYLPDRTAWDVACQWGHATSDDLLTWHTEPVALVPDPAEGEAGVWSGSLVRPSSEEAVILYTGVGADHPDFGWVRRALAADPSWTTWKKEDVVLRPPGGDVTVIRDPFVQRYGDGWRMLLAGSLADGSGALWTSMSQDLRTWTPLVLAASGRETGSLWECPSLLDVGGRPVLVVSTGGTGAPHSVIAAFCVDHGDRFEPGPWQRLTYGPSLYAASGFTDESGEPGVIAWLRELGDPEAGWMGAHSLPYGLQADGDHLVALPPAGLLERRVGKAADGLLPPVADLEWTARPGEVLVAPDLFRLEATDRAVEATVGGNTHAMPWRGGPLRVVLDGPVLEVFGDSGVPAVPVPATGQDGLLTGDTERVTVHRLG